MYVRLKDISRCRAQQIRKLYTEGLLRLRFAECNIEESKHACVRHLHMQHTVSSALHTLQVSWTGQICAEAVLLIHLLTMRIGARGLDSFTLC